MNTLRSLSALCFAFLFAGAVASAGHHEEKKADQPAKACCGSDKACCDKGKAEDKKSEKCENKPGCEGKPGCVEKTPEKAK